MDRQRLLEGLASRIAALHRSHPVRVAIDGIDAAGKTTFANELAAWVEARGRPVIRASVDDFQHPAAVRLRRGSTSPEGYYHESFDHDALLASLLRPLGPGGSLAFRRAVFDLRSDEPVDAPLEHARPDAVLLLDGVFLLRPELRAHFEHSIFLRVDFGVALARAEARDLALFGSVDAVRRRYRERYHAGQRLYLGRVRPERRASVVIDNDDPGRPRIVGGVRRDAGAGRCRTGSPTSSS